jgi:pimeloyl-ACP methyl ester carboxylesterase
VYAAEERQVDVVGWSFGGLLARWVAHERPDQVRSVVTLGSPWRPEGERTRTTPLFERSRRTRGLSERAEDVIDALRRPLPVPTTAIWSRTDGIVGWRGCQVDEGETARNVSVPSSHLGMASNPFALAALTSALSEEQG